MCVYFIPHYNAVLLYFIKVCSSWLKMTDLQTVWLCEICQKYDCIGTVNQKCTLCINLLYIGCRIIAACSKFGFTRRAAFTARGKGFKTSIETCQTIHFSVVPSAFQEPQTEAAFLDVLFSTPELRAIWAQVYGVNLSWSVDPSHFYEAFEEALFYIFSGEAGEK